MRIGLIADTHIADIMLPRVLDDLERIAPVFAALGNHDHGLETDPRVKHHHVFDFEGHRVVMVHQFEFSDGPSAFDHSRPREHLIELCAHFMSGETGDVIVFGDSHVERVEQFGDVLLVNPGSPTFPRNMSPRLGHIGFLTLERGRQPFAEIRHLSDYTSG